MHRTSMELEDWRVTAAANITNSGYCEPRGTERAWESPETVGKLNFSSLNFANFSQAGERWKPQPEHPRIRPDAVHGKSRKKQKYNSTTQKTNRGRQLEVNPGTSGSSFASTPDFQRSLHPRHETKPVSGRPTKNCCF